ncbi:hypothetical protein KA977_12485 [Candidatus Dependentiae bacterium]|nr:hypothetical protein [Candidatus Dependentiae bacterium]
MKVFGPSPSNRQPAFKKSYQYIIIIALSVIILSIFFINIFSSGKPANQPADSINDIKKYEERIAEKWVDIEALLFCARQYYIIAKEDEIYTAYLNSNLNIPEKFYIKTLYKFEKLGYKNLALLQDKYENKSPDLRNSFLKALSYIDENLYHKSLNYYRKVEALSKNLLTAKDYYYIGMIYYKKKEFFANAAIDYFNIAINKGLDDSEIYLSLGNAYFMLNLFDDALKYYKKADKLSGYNPVIKYNIAWTLFNNKNYKESLETSENAAAKIKIVLDKNKPENFVIEDKQIINNTVPTMTPQMLAKFHYISGLNYIKMNDFIKALDSFKNAELYIKNDDTIYEHIGTIYYNLKNYELASINFKISLNINPENSKSSELLSKLKK